MKAFLLDPYQTGFMQRALVEVLLLAALGAFVGVHVLLRRLAFLTEALQHTVFPGLAIAFAAGWSLLGGALLAALATVVLLVWLDRQRAIDSDAALAVLVAGFFALGVAVVSRGTGFATDLNVLLFGRVLDVDRAQIMATLVLGGLAAAVLGALHKELVLRAFDPSHAEAAGYRIARLDFVLDVCVALVVVVAVRAVGTVLVIAFFVTPAATARLLRLSIPATMLAAAALAAALGWIGLSASYEASIRHDVNLAAGASIVALYTAAFAVVGGGIALGRRVIAR